MSKPAKNNFLTIYGITTAILGLGLGYLCYSASGERTAAEDALENKRKQLEALQKQPLYPNKENAAAAKQQAEEFRKQVDEITGKFTALQIPLNSAVKDNPDAISQKLVKFKSQLETIATSLQVKLPKEFALGLNRYVTSAPDTTSAPEVDFLAEGVNALLDRLIRHGITSIDSIDCPEMAYEKDQPKEEEAKPKTGTASSTAKKTTPSSASKSSTAGKTKETTKDIPPPIEEKTVLRRYKIYLTFSGSEQSVADCLNDIASIGDNGPFLTVNNLRIESSMKAGPPKGAELQPSDADEKGITRDAAYIMGNELVTVWLDLDLVRFLTPEEHVEALKPPAKTPASKS